MWIGDVNVPDDLVAAHRENRLVVFVGAGASVDAPSSLPTFRGLAERIATESGHTLAAGELDHSDRLLGDLDLDGSAARVDVHRRVADLIGSAASSPNNLHRAIGSLALAGSEVRIITTNYDRHLSACIPQSPEFRAPALPVGDDFSGIVYVHGSVDQPPRFLVVTDSDFGRAYLTDAWAARFLERMFRRFAVLFIGYSHDDVVMSYLARGLPPTSERYAFTHQPDGRRWRRLGIRPVAYAVTDLGSHDALTHTVQRWADLSTMGLLDHQQRVAALVAQPPSQIPEEESYLEGVIADPIKVAFFVEHARGAEWLEWVQTRPEFQRLFEAVPPMGDASRVLAWWFAQNFVTDPELSELALTTLRSRGGLIGEVLWYSIAQQLHVVGSPRPDHLRTWIVFLLEFAPRQHLDLIDYALTACQWPQDRDAALLLFDYLTHPHVTFDRFTGLSGQTRVELSIRGDNHWLTEAWENLLKPNLIEIAADLAPIVDHHLQLAQRLLREAGSASDDWDPLSVRRAAIERHGQDSIRDGVDMLIDAAREVLIALLREDPELGQSYLRSWSRSDSTLLRRLALYGWAERSDVCADDKLAWLDASGALYTLQLRHEVFQLIARALPHASPDAAAGLVARVLEGPLEHSEHTDYEIYNHLVWITQVAADLRPALDALANFQTTHSEYRPSPHPDFFSWHDVGTIGSQLPLSPADLHQLIEDDPDAAIQRLRAYEGNTSPWNGPTWTDALQVLSATVSEWPDDGHTVLRTMQLAPVADVVRSVVRGWSQAALSDEQYRTVATRLDDLMDDFPLIDEVASFLRDKSKGELASPETRHSSTARNLAVKAWDQGQASADEYAEETDDWLSVAINDWAGNIVDFWTHSISSEWRAAGETWSNLPSDARDALDTIINGETRASELAHVVLASELLFLFSADEAWCREAVLPLLDWDRDERRARRSWDGYLRWGRFNDRLLDAGLLDHYLRAIPRLTGMSEHLVERFCGHLATVALQSEIDPFSNGWLTSFTTAADLAARTRWIDEVSWQLTELPDEAAEANWARWMRFYWEQRLASVPIVLTPQEATAMGAWTVALRESFHDAVDLALSHEAGLNQHGRVLHSLVTSPLVDDYPADVVRLVAHLLAGTTGPFYDCHSLSTLVPKLRSSVGRAGVEAIVEQALRLGCTSAQTWQ